jgi:asparagine synthase (glutamine-hydrolysing)
MKKNMMNPVYAELIAKKYKTNHHRILAKPAEFLQAIPEILAAWIRPVEMVPNTYLVAKHTRANQIKVALSGLGGDELFAGYNKFLFFVEPYEINGSRRFLSPSTSQS